MPAAPVLDRSEQLSSDALILMPPVYGNFRNLAVDHVPVHWIRRHLQSAIYESNHLTTRFRYKSNSAPARFRRMLTPLPKAFG